MKKIRMFVALIVFMTMGLTGAVRADEFDNLSYRLDYPAVEGSFALAIGLPGWSWDIDLTMPLAPDMPEHYLSDALDCYCDPESPDFDPMICMMLQQILTSDAMDWLNNHWNQITGQLLGLLPVHITTHQFPWPVNTLGHMTMQDYGFEWPCTWAPSTGDYTLLPLHVETGDTPGYGIDILQIYDFRGNGRIDRNSANRLDGLFDFSSAMLITAGEVSVSVTIGIPGYCTALPL